MRRRWTDHEIERLHRLYPRHGRQFTARLLKRTPDAVRQKARKEGLLVGMAHGWLTITEVASFANRSTQTVRRQADADGVTKVAAGRVAMVPEKWANAFREEAKARQSADQLEGAWFTIHEAAEETGLHHRTIHNALQGKGSLAKYIDLDLARRGSKRTWYLSPTLVNNIKRLQASNWIPTREVARLWSCSEAVIFKGLDGRGSLAEILENVRTVRIPNPRSKGVVRAFHQADISKATPAALTALQGARTKRDAVFAA